MLPLLRGRVGLSRRATRALTFALLLPLALGGCIGAVDRADLEREAALRGAGIDGDRVREARDAVAEEMGVDPGEVRFTRINIRESNVYMDASAAAAPRVWDSYIFDGRSARVWTEVKADTVDGWFALEDLPALDRLTELVAAAHEERGIEPGTVAPRGYIDCNLWEGDWEDELVEEFLDGGHTEILHCPAMISIHFSDDRETYELVRFTADGEVMRR